MRRAGFIVGLLLSLTLSAQSVTMSAQSVTMPALMDSVHCLIQPIRVLSYGGGTGRTWEGFNRTDQAGNGVVRDRYSDSLRYFVPNNKAVSGMHIEHIWANSWWGHVQNFAYKDLFNLYPADGNANIHKNNNPIGVVNGTVAYDNGVIKVGKNSTMYGKEVTVWEPADEWKGDFARTYFYMACCYSNFRAEKLWKTTEGLLTVDTTSNLVMQEPVYQLMLQWARQDPVDQIERDRCDSIERIQGNRNPFVDVPGLAEYIWGDSTGNFDLQRIKACYDTTLHIQPADPTTQVVFSVTPKELTMTAQKGNPSKLYPLAVFMKNVSQNGCTVQCDAPFQVSLDSSNWSQEISTSYATQGFQVRMNGQDELGDCEGELVCTVVTGDECIVTATCHVSECSFWENFEPSGKTGYTTANLIGNAATWEMNNVMTDNSEKDRPREGRCARMKQEGVLTMVTDKPNGCDTLRFWACSYGEDKNVSMKVSYSADGGQNWQIVKQSLPLTATMTQYKYGINKAGTARLKFESLNTGSTMLRACIDDIQMGDYTVGPAQLQEVKSNTQTNACYDVLGRQVRKDAHGLIIEGGKLKWAGDK